MPTQQSLTPIEILRKYADPALRPTRMDKPADLAQWPVSRFTGKIISLAQQEDEERWFQQQEREQPSHALHSLSHIDQPSVPKKDRRRRHRPKAVPIGPQEEKELEPTTPPPEPQLQKVERLAPLTSASPMPEETLDDFKERVIGIAQKLMLEEVERRSS